MAANQTAQGQNSDPEIELAFDAQGESGTFTVTNMPPGPGFTGNWRIKPETVASYHEQTKVLLTQEIIGDSKATRWSAALASAVPFLIVVAAGIFHLYKNDEASRFLILTLSVFAALAAIVAGFNLVTRKAPGPTFTLAIFAAMATVLGIVAKVFDLPGS